MFRIFIFLLVLISSPALANDTLYFKLSNPWNSVLAADGKYTRKAVAVDGGGWVTFDYNAKGLLVAKSFYSDTTFKLKWRKHEYFNEEKGYLEEVRSYNQEGFLHGIRAGFGITGDTLWRETYVDLSIVDSIQYDGYKEGIKMLHPIEFTEATLLGGVNGWSRFIEQNITYPAQAAKKKIHGEVVITFLVLTNGKTKFLNFEKSVHPLLDEEVKRVVLLSPLWKPAVLEGRKVNAFRRLPVIF